MPFGRILITATLVFAGLAAVAPGSAAAPHVTPTKSAKAAAAPTSPYTAVVVDGTAGSTLLGAGSYVDTNGTADVVLAPLPDNGLRFTAHGGLGADSAVVDVVPPTGTSFAAGTTYPTATSPTATDAELQVAVRGSTCSTQTGSLTVDAVTADGTGAITSLAASFTDSCGTESAAVHGLLRDNSTSGFAAATADPDQGWDFGSQLDSGNGPAEQITLTSAGSDALHVGAAAITQTVASFTISADTCSSQTVAAAAQCTVTVTPHPTAEGLQTATLTIPTDIPGGLVIPLQVTGLSYHSIEALAGPEVVHLYWDALPHPNGSTPAGTQIFRGPSAASLTPLTTLDQAIADDTPYDDTGLTAGTDYFYAVQPLDAGGAALAPMSAAVGANPWPKGGAGTFIPLKQARLLDTRTGLGAGRAKVGAGKVLTLHVGGRASVPNTNITDVVLNVAVTDVTAATSILVFPAGTARPATASLYANKGQTIANLITVKVGVSGEVDIANASGSVDLVADIVGFYAATTRIRAAYGDGSQYQWYDSPVRVLDTRTGGFGALPGGYYGTVYINYDSSIAPHVKALALNVSVLAAGAAGHATVFPFGQAVPGTSSVDFAKGVTSSNLVIVKPGTYNSPDGSFPAFNIYNGSTKGIQLVVHLLGFFDDNTLADGLRFIPAPTVARIADSRSGLGLPGSLGAGKSAVIDPTTHANYETTCLDLNVAAIKPTSASSALTLWPSGLPGVSRPSIAQVHPQKGETGATQVITPVAAGNKFGVYNAAGTSGVLVDIAGTYDLWPQPGDGHAGTPHAQHASPATAKAAGPGPVRAGLTPPGAGYTVTPAGG